MVGRECDWQSPTAELAREPLAKAALHLKRF